MRDGGRSKTAAWKRGLLTAVLGIGMVLAAGQIREKWEEQSLAEASARTRAGKTEEAAQPGEAGKTEEAAQPGEAGRAGGAGHAEQPPEEKKKIALTFDDGPHPIYTERLLDGLAERGVKAAFFLLGCNIEGNEGIVRRMAEEGHLVGNHTFYHVDITTLPQEEACAEIQDTSRKITEITGEPVEYVRPPFGNWNKELECELMMIPVFWTLDTLDWSTRNTDLLVEQVVSEAEENDIILMHDSYDSTVKAALRIIDLLQAEGFEFVRADELILE